MRLSGQAKKDRDARVKAMLADGYSPADIIAETGASQSAVYRMRDAMQQIFVPARPEPQKNVGQTAVAAPDMPPEELFEETMERLRLANPAKWVGFMESRRLAQEKRDEDNRYHKSKTVDCLTGIAEHQELILDPVAVRAWREWLREYLAAGFPEFL